MLTYVIIAAVSYLLGSIPFGYLLVRIFKKQDIRTSGSGNIGATNVARTAPGLGIATLVLDAAKGFIAVISASLLLPTDVGLGVSNGTVRHGSLAHTEWYLHFAVAALFSVMGHMFPLWLRFRGGKGVATAVGAFTALAPAAMAVSLGFFVVTVALSRYVSLGSIVGALTFPISMYLLNSRIKPAVIGVVTFTALLIIAKHHENIRRLLSGTENRFALKRKVVAVQLANED